LNEISKSYAHTYKLTLEFIVAFMIYTFDFLLRLCSLVTFSMV